MLVAQSPFLVLVVLLNTATKHLDELSLRDKQTEQFVTP